jgi:hypothetical protein
MIDKFKVRRLLSQIECVDFVMVDLWKYHNPTARIDVDRIVGEEENEVLCVRWEVDDEFKLVKFTEGGLMNAVINKNKITITDTEGEPISLSLFNIVPVNIK